MKKLVIFDLDGTIIDSSSVICDTINYVRANLGLNSIDKDLLLSKVNDPYINPAEFFYKTKEFTKEQTKLFTTYYNKHCITDVKLYDGIEDELKYLSKKYYLALATNAFTNTAKKVLIHLNISQYFDYIIGADKAKPKPSCDMLVKCLDYFNINKDYAILIGDSLKDKIAANSCKIEIVLVGWGLSKLDSSIETIKKITDIRDVVDRYFKNKI